MPVSSCLSLAESADDARVDAALSHGMRSLEDFAVLLSPAAGRRLETLAARSHALTLQRFGKTMQLFAPLYVSNECANVCTYCGFSMDNQIARRTLSVKEVQDEASILHAQGFRHLLLVSGEHAKYVPNSYLENVAKALSKNAPSLSIEVAPLGEEQYRKLVAAGVDGLVVYQETYDREAYAAHHTKGRKIDFDWRLDTPERGARAGMRRLGIGFLMGLADWRFEAISLVAHARYLLKHHWDCFLTVSIPRLRPAAGGFVPQIQVSDRQFTQLICALRLALPDAGIVLSTREHARLRDGLMKLGVTHMSAGSRTEPGGYSAPLASEAQFEVEDTRSPQEIGAVLRSQGYEAVWKDWEEALHG